MSKHTLGVRGHTFEWDDNEIDYSRKRMLLNLYTYVSDMHSWSMYVGEDPEKAWNNHVADLQSNVIDWLIELEAGEEK